MNVIIIGSDKKENSVLEKMLSEDQTVNLKKVTDNIVEAIEYLSTNKDISIFLAAELLGESSVELMAFYYSLPPIVVFSKSSEHAVNAFDEGVADYILLPSSSARISQSIKRLRQRIEKKQIHNSSLVMKDMYVRSNAKSLRVLFSDVLFIEAMADYVIIHTEGFKYIVHYTMKGIQDQLPTDLFVRVHRSYIVNLDKIHAIDNQEIIIKDKRIPIGGSNKEMFFSRLNLI